jgi:hypothetical protein
VITMRRGVSRNHGDSRVDGDGKLSSYWFGVFFEVRSYGIKCKKNGDDGNIAMLLLQRIT